MAIETIKELASIGKGHNRFIKLKIIKVGEEFMLDLRQWVESDTYAGPDGKKGVMIHWDAINQIIEERLFEQARDIMDGLS